MASSNNTKAPKQGKSQGRSRGGSNGVALQATAAPTGSSSHTRGLMQPGSAGVQAKLQMGQPGDTYEQEADRAGDKAAQGEATGPIAALPAGGLSRMAEDDKAQAMEEDKAQAKEEDEAQAKEEDKAQAKEEDKAQAKEEEKAQAMEEDKAQAKEEDKAQAKEEEKAQAKEEEKAQSKEEDEAQAKEEEKAQSKEEDEAQAKEEEKAQSKEEDEAQAKEEEKAQSKEEDEAQAKEEEKAQSKEEDEAQAKEEKEAQAKEEEKAQAKGDAKKSKPSGKADVQAKLKAQKGGGMPLPEGLRTRMEKAFGTNFAHVRVHTGPEAAALAKALRAKAFTYGNHIFFNQGQFNPSSAAGKKLLGHELTHVVQQGGGSATLGGIQRKAAPGGAADAKAPAPSDMPTEVVGLDGAAFTPSQAVADYLEAKGRKGGKVRARFGNIAAGEIHVVKKGDTYKTKSLEALPANLPFLQPMVGMGLTPALGIRIKDNQISGMLTIAEGAKVHNNAKSVLNWMKSHPKEMGWLGMDNIRIPDVTNEISGGSLRVESPNIGVRIGGYVDGTIQLGIHNTAMTFNAQGTVNIPGLQPTQLSISKDEAGNLSGSASAGVSIANFNGTVDIAYKNGAVDAEGTVGYSTEKISGSVTLKVTDAAKAKNVAMEQLNPEQINQQATENTTADQPDTDPKPGPRALAGWGEVDFAFTPWMTGKAKVIIDSEGHVTIVGEIAPPAEVELFPQKDYKKELINVEARARYGVPLVGSVFVFANIGLNAVAKLGPAKIYNIKVAGTFSTDPRVFNSFSLQGSLNISAFAGIQIRGEGGVGIELLGHDIKAGVGLDATGGIKGYVDATPTFGYREKADPKAGKQGEFYLNGHMEIAAQPFIGLGGDLFVELDSPWWSPAPDKKWTWPLFSMEYPLPGEFGIGADVDYVLGSNKLPEVQLGEVDFNQDKFMTDLMSDNVPKKKSRPDKKGTFEDKAKGGGPKDPKMVDSKGKGSGKPATGKQEKKGRPATEKENTAFMNGNKALKELAQASEKKPFNRAGIMAALAPIKKKHGFQRLEPKRQGKDWAVHAALGPLKTGKPISIKGFIDPKEKELEAKGDTDIKVVYPQKGFDTTGDGHHTLMVQEKNGVPRLMIASTPTHMESFLAEVEKRPRLSKKKKTALTAAKNLLTTKINPLLAELDKQNDQDTGTPDEAVQKQQELLALEVQLSGLLKTILGTTPLKSLEDKYALEGLTGTYQSMPKPKGDDLTADHQPQAAIYKLLTDAGRFPYFATNKEVKKRASGTHANGAYAINLHDIRHKAGRTYGPKGTKTKKAFLDQVTALENKWSDTTTDSKKRTDVVDAIRTDHLNKDVEAINTIAKKPLTHEYYADLHALNATQDDKETLRNKIQDRTLQGEGVMKAQDMNSLKNEQ